MSEAIFLGDIAISVARKTVKNVHLTVHPPAGRVTLVAPMGLRLEVARAYAISKLGWIRDQQAKLLSQARETPRQFVERESHSLWGRHYLLSVVEQEEPPSVRLNHRRILLCLRPGSTLQQRETVMQAWQRTLMHGVVPALIKKWEAKLGVKVNSYHLQRMKTKWGSCNHRAGKIRLNTELVKKPKDLLEYVIVHEMLHLIEPSHGQRFVNMLNQYYPSWREARLELNALPLTALPDRTQSS